MRKSAYTVPMMAQVDELAVARQPQQARSRKRFEAVLNEAERLLARDGLNGFSIPTIAENLGYNRRAIYSLFPTPYAILNELTGRYIGWLGQELASMGPDPDVGIEQLIAHHVFIASNYHNRNPVGRLLILGGAVTDKSFRAQELTAHHLGNIGRRLLRTTGYRLPEAPPDIPVVAVELGLACMRISNGVYGRISRDYAIEAVFAMQSYLAAALDDFPAADRDRIGRLADQLMEPEP